MTIDETYISMNSQDQDQDVATKCRVKRVRRIPGLWMLSLWVFALLFSGHAFGEFFSVDKEEISEGEKATMTMTWKASRFPHTAEAVGSNEALFNYSAYVTVSGSGISVED